MNGDDTLLNELGEALFWQYEMELYKRLKLHDSLVTSGSLAEWFLAVKDTAALGRLYGAAENKHMLMRLDSSPAAILSAHYDYRDSLMRYIYLIEEEYADTTLTQEQKNILAAQADSLKIQILNSKGSVATAMSDWAVIRYEWADSVIAMYNAITPNRSIEQWYKDINIVYLNTVVKDIDTFTTGEWSIVENLAFMCPLEGGEATALARSLYAMKVDTTMFDDEAACNVSYKKEKEWISRAKREKPAQAFVMYPNPTSDKVYIACSLPINRRCEIFIVNMLGQQVMMSNQLFEKGLLTIDTRNFTNGLYNVKVVSDGESLYSGKLSIIK